MRSSTRCGRCDAHALPAAVRASANGRACQVLLAAAKYLAGRLTVGLTDATNAIMKLLPVRCAAPRGDSVDARSSRFVAQLPAVQVRHSDSYKKTVAWASIITLASVGAHAHLRVRCTCVACV